MRSFKIKIDAEAFSDIMQISNWYNEQVADLGLRFQKNAKLQINTLKYSALSHGIRYNNVRCMLIKKFPFLIHYKVDEANNSIVVFAIIHTSRNPKIWEQRERRI